LSAVLKKRKVEAHGDFILGPVSPKEYKDTVAELNGSRTNRVFEFFKINPPECVGFAKHHEAAEKKAAALAAAEADFAVRCSEENRQEGCPCRGHCYRRREGPEETRRVAGGLAPITQEDPGRRR
jgi:hypothetical protein